MGSEMVRTWMFFAAMIVSGCLVFSGLGWLIVEWLPNL